MPYRRILSIPGTRRFVAAGLLGRFPISMLGLGSVLLVTSVTGSYTTAGVVTATLALASAFAAPVSGRWADAHGQRRVLIPTLGVHAVGVVALIATTLAHAPAALLVPPAAVAGASVPQVGSMVRTRWTAIVGGTPNLDTALALESALDESIFVMGPVLATVLATTVWPAAGLVAELTLALLGGGAFAAQRSTEPAPNRQRHVGDVRAFGVPGVRMLIATFTAIGTIFGGIDLSMVAFTAAHGHRGAAGLVLAFFASGSLLAGLTYGLVTWKAPLGRRFQRSILCLAVGTVPVALAPSVPAIAIAGLFLGLSISPTIVAGTGLIESMVPPTALTEGFAWVSTALGVGVALGSSAAGRIVDAAGPRAGLLMSVGGAVLAASVALAAAGVVGRSMRPPLPDAGP